VAQREILEVLLNEPELLAEVRGQIDVGDFDVPVLRDVALALLDVAERPGGFSLRAVLAGTESTQTGEVIVELQRVGEAKDNYRSRLLDALAVLGRQREHSGTIPADDARGDSNISGVRQRAPSRQNPHSIGLT
jgi:hypothetical protein